MGTRPPRKRSRTFSSLTTDHSWSLTPGGTNPRSLAVLAPERVTRNLIVKTFYSIVFGESKIPSSHLYGPWEHSRRRLFLSRSPPRFVLKKIFVPSLFSCTTPLIITTIYIMYFLRK